MKNYLIIILISAFLIACTEDEPAFIESLTYQIDDDMLSRFEFFDTELGDVEYELVLNAKVTFNPLNVVPYIPVVNGQVLSVKFSIGDYVRKGQVLVDVRSGDMAGTISELIEAENAVQIAEKNHKLTRRMFDAGIASGRDLLISENELKIANQLLLKAQDYIELYGGRNESGTTQQIKAPANGYIVQRAISTGMMLQAGDEPIFTISDLNSVWIEASVYESDLGLVEQGQNAQIRIVAFPDTIYNATVDNISNIIDPDDQTVKIRMNMKNDDKKLKPGMFARVTVGYDAQRVLPYIPANSLIFDKNSNFVVVVNENNIPEVRQVQVYAQRGDRVFINEGLSAGERIITSNQLLVYSHLTY